MQDVSIDETFNQMKLPTIVSPTNDYEKSKLLQRETIRPK